MTHPPIRRLATLCIIALLHVTACTSDDGAEEPQHDQGVLDDQGVEGDKGGSSLDMDNAGGDEGTSGDGGDEGLADEGVDEEEMDVPPELIVLPERPWDVRERGPYNVGYATGTFTYAAKPDGAEREIDVVYWYPTLEAKGRRASYMRGFVSLGEALDEPPIADTQETYPMLVFSHGNGSIAEQSYTFTEHFASHGWIVVAPYHTENTVFDNPSAINYLSSIDRPQDIVALLDWTEALPAEEEHVIDGHIDFEKLVMSGHSFGALTTMVLAGADFDVDTMERQCADGTIGRQRLCELITEENKEIFRDGFSEPRFKAAIPHTPGVGTVFNESVDTIEMPLLMMTAARDRSLPAEENGDYMWERMTSGPHARFDLPNGGHFTYSNMCTLFGAIEQASEDGCNDTFIKADVALPIINHYSLAWAEYHVLGDMRHQALVEGSDRPYDQEVVVYETIEDKRED